VLRPTADQVRTLAPDGAAARAGQELANPRRWTGTGRTATAAWGLCQGSGSSPYQTAADLAGPAYRCSCPSRKIPCKHALGLLYLIADGAIGEAQPPDWVATWLESREKRAVTATTGVVRAAEADPAARARRIESREKKVAAGIAELDRWLGDLMRRGLDGARGEGYRFWDSMGARLVDAQAGGLGRWVRSLGSAANAGDSWPHLLLEGSARLHLVCEAYRRSDDLPEPLRADVRSMVGWTTKEEDLDPADSVEDRWLVVGSRVDDTGQIITARTFLLGEASRRFALHLAFGVGAAPPTLMAMPGQAFRAALAFYPSASPLRAAVRPILVPDGEVSALPAVETVDDIVRGHAERLARNPFVDAWPVALGPVVPVMREDRLLARQEDGAALPVVPASLGPRLLAISGGHPVMLVGEWNGSSLRPLSVLAGTRLVGLHAPEGDPPAFRDGDPGWAELVSAALLGTERAGDALRIPDSATSVVSASDRSDREHELLAAAGIISLRRRAGRRATLDQARVPDPAPDDARTPISGPAARLVGLVVVEERGLVPEVLGLVRASGRRLPDEWLPELLSLGRREPALASEVAELAGPRAAWLASVVPDLADGSNRGLGPDWDEAWEAARGAKPLAALLRSMRAADPAAARERLGGWLPELDGEERAAVIEALAEGLGADDEPILTNALGDRRADVRRAAADLLVRLDGSALTQLVESHVRSLVTSQGKLRPSLAVSLPTLDPDLQAAGFGGRPPPGLGERAWLLKQLIAHVPPARWNEWLRIDPPGLVERALRSDEARAVLEGWIEATSRFGDPGWAAALIGEPAVRTKIQINVVQALDRLDAAGLGSVAAAVARRIEPTMLAVVAARCPPPWPRSLSDVVLDVIGKLATTAVPDQAFYDLVRVAAYGVPPERGDALVALASHQDQVRPALTGAIETVRLREQIRAAFADLPPVEP
jgi:hypothetical protein